MIKLYGASISRAAIIRWYLEELEIPFEFIKLDLAAGEHRQPEFLAINPMGKVPAIVDEDLQLWESGAILLYLFDKYAQKPVSLEDRAKINQWIFFANSTLASGIFSETSRAKETPILLNPINQILEQQTYILGDEFSLVDIAVGSTLAFVNQMLKLDLSGYPSIQKYLQVISERPAFQKSMLQKW